MTASSQDFVKLDKATNTDVYELGKEAERLSQKDESWDEEEATYHNAEVVSAKINSILESNQHAISPYYIWMYSVYEGMSATLTQQIGKRDTKPDPQPGMTLWMFNPKGAELSVVWHLPSKNTWDVILNQPEIYPKSLVQNIKDYQVGILK